MRRHVKSLWLASMLALAAAPEAGAHPHEPPLSNYETKLQRLNAVGWQLVRGNADYCANTRMAAGWVLNDALTYSEAPLVERQRGAAIWIAAIAPNGPAAQAGLARNDIPLAVGSVALQAMAVGDTVWQRLLDVDMALARVLSESPVDVTFRRDGVSRQAFLVGQRVCTADFEVRADDDDAIADRRRVILGEDFVGFAWGDERLAAIVAHELAHVLLGHDSRGKSRNDIREMERVADVLMPWLLANAGYPPELAADAMAQWGSDHEPRFAFARKHDRWPQRVAAIETEIAVIKRWQSEGRALDWRKRLAEREAS